jgi:hypothetical protein
MSRYFFIDARRPSAACPGRGDVIVELTADGFRVHHADDCTRLSVATDLNGHDVDAALRCAGAGARDGATGTILLDVSVLHERARAAASAADWDARWSAMIAYAGRKGWLTPDGTAVRAHLERMTGNGGE